MKTIALLLLAAAALFGELGGDPQTAIISTGDVALFWKAFGRWKSEGAKEDRLASILQSESSTRAQPEWRLHARSRRERRRAGEEDPRRTP